MKQTITIAFLVIIAVACFKSMTLAYKLIAAYCMFKYWTFVSQPIIRKSAYPDISSVILALMLLLIGPVIRHHEIAHGGYRIVSGVVNRKYVTRFGNRPICHTIVKYEQMDGGIKEADIREIDVYKNTDYWQKIIMAEPLLRPENISVVEYNPSDELIEKTRHGLYTKRDLSDINSIQEDPEVRANLDKNGKFAFFRHHTFLSGAALLLLAAILSFFGDKIAIFAEYGSIAVFSLLCMASHEETTSLGLFVLGSIIALWFVIEEVSKESRVTSEIKRNGGYITVGESYEIKLNKYKLFMIKFFDATGEICIAHTDKYYGKNIIVAHSTFNDSDVICLSKYPSEDMKNKYKNGIFIGPCSNINLYKAEEDNRTREKYLKLYT